MRQYRLRSTTSATLRTPYSAHTILTSTRNAYVHSTVNLWNSLSHELRSSDSLYNFKRNIKRLMYVTNHEKYNPMLYSLLPPGRATVYHCRLRLGLSALNLHRFTYNFIDIKSCPRCNYGTEDVKHFLLHYPAYAAQRAVLMESLRDLLPTYVLDDECLMETYLIFGSRDLDYPSNLSIFSAVFTFLVTSGRFANGE